MESKNIDKTKMPLIEFLLYFLLFLVCYSSVSTLFENVIEVDTISEIIVKRVLQFSLYFILIFVLHRRKGLKINSYFKSFSFKKLVLFIVVTLSFILLYENTIEILLDKIQGSGDAVGVSDIELVGIIIQSLITAPLVEEILIRGYLFETLTKKHSNTISIIICSIVFACLHFDYLNSIFYFIIGLILSYVYAYTKSLWSSIIIHFIVNLIYITGSMLNSYVIAMS